MINQALRFAPIFAALLATRWIAGTSGWQMLTDVEQMQMRGGTGYYTCAVGASSCTVCTAGTCAPNAAGTACILTGGSDGCKNSGGLASCISGGAGCVFGTGGIACGGPQSPAPCSPTATTIRANGTLQITACGGGTCAASSTQAAQTACPNKCS